MKMLKYLPTYALIPYTEVPSIIRFLLHQKISTSMVVFMSKENFPNSTIIPDPLLILVSKSSQPYVYLRPLSISNQFSKVYLSIHRFLH